ncbi:MAG: lysophospholipase [Bdellovibrionales bacterium]|nr:lysophospholipase [Bdellovibrionales bacterium]
MSFTRSEGHFKGYKDTQIFRQSWKFGDTPKKVLIVTHGLGEHSDAYERFAQGVGVDGLHIYAYDLRGHGRSEGRWGVVERFSDYRKDLSIFYSLLQREYQERGQKVPFYLLGHSMGGLVTASTVIREEVRGLSGVILSAPLFGVAVQVPVVKEKAGRFLERWFPNQTLYNEVKYEHLSRDRDILKTYEKDPLRHDRISLRLYTEIQDEMPFVRLGAPRFHETLLIQHGTNDHIADPGASKAFFEKAESKDKTLKLYDGAFHEAYNDLGREQVFQDFKTWLEKR